MAVKDPNNPESPVAHSSPIAQSTPANISGETNQIQGINVSFRSSTEIGNRSSNEDGRNNRTTSSQNETVEGEYSQNQELNITFGNISMNTDSGNEQISIVEKMVKTVAGVTQTQFRKINYAPVKTEDKESQTVDNQNKKCCKCSTGSNKIRMFETCDSEESDLQAVRNTESCFLTSDVIFKNLENPEDSENHKDKFIGVIHKYIRTLASLFAFSKFKIFFKKKDLVEERLRSSNDVQLKMKSN